MTGVNDIRESFLSYFKQAKHEVVSSAPLVPLNDPTLMFVNAGMVPFKNLFTGVETRDYVRAVSSQKCVRAGGKHNDLDNVGYTARHHTFFEMLGNFSFGDYFKEEAIFHAWTLLTDTFGLPKDKLWVTVYHTDDQAFDLWKKIAGLPVERIIRIPTHDNFWSMGDTGPCGPCSEIFFDHGEHIAGGPPGSPDEDGDRFVEIWNLVFMQFEQLADGNRLDLPKPSIDTGMGLERIAAVLQGTHDNYEIDTFKALINAASDITGVAPTGEHAPSFNVISDHLRACSFLISDGVLPSNEGRGYVLRRIMRRAMRHAHMLGYKDLLMHQLVPSLVSEMGHAYPSLTRAEALITETLKLEEGRFKDMLGRGMKLLSEAVGPLKPNQNLPGDVAFKLYDTFGFPLDLTEDALRTEGRGVDVDGFNTCMDKQKAAARAAWTGSGQAATDAVWFDIREEHGTTEFLGYKSEVGEGIIQAIVKDGKPIKSAKKGDDVALIINQTPFYGESGGQMGDVGGLSIGDDIKVIVTDTKKQLGDLHVHLSTVEAGKVSVGDAVEMKINKVNRDAIRANHSATHLLHEALRRELGDHVTQKGSMVAHDRLRFDIAQPRAVTADELANVEKDVNARIRENASVSTRLMTPDAAQEEGAMALFGEKYGDEVRVVSMGSDDDKSHGNYSIELCGGTHVSRTGDIGLLKIISESAVSSGVRRIEALTGEAARHYMNLQESILKKAAGVLKSSPSEVAERVEAILADRKSLEKQLAEAKKKLAMGGGSGPETIIEDVAGVKFHGQVLDGVSSKDLRGLADEAKKQMGSGVVVLIAVNDGKAGILVGVTDDLTGTHNAVNLVKVGTSTLGGKGGGGRPDMAQAGGPNGGDAAKALDAIKAEIAK
jgi:alanyl-tRNA synthetase